MNFKKHLKLTNTAKFTHSSPRSYGLKHALTNYIGTIARLLKAYSFEYALTKVTRIMIVNYY